MKHCAACLVAIALLLHAHVAAAHQLWADPSVANALREGVVPVLLPLSLPRALGTIRSVAVIRAWRSGYYIGYSTVKDCAGALACAVFHVAGFAGPVRLESSGHDRKLRLFDGTAAVFRPADCSGASCTEASLFFHRSGALYELDAKTGCSDFRVLTSVYRRLRVVRSPGR
jgi:hypothetical protein